MKDRFSSGSQLYQLARPSYPASLIQEILKHVATPQFAWDCGAGSGQLTQLLAPHFDAVVATDISAHQLQHAPYFENVSYQVQQAEQTTLPAQSIDLITVAQAIHWFNFDAFYREVCRVLKPDGVLAVVGYGLIQVEDQMLHHLIQQVYFETLKGYWDAERQYVDEGYRTIPFPLNEISTPQLTLQYQWNASQLLKYLSTWSAVGHYRQQKGQHPLLEVAEYLKDRDQEIHVEFPVLLRLGTRPIAKKKSSFRRKYLLV